MNRPDLSGTGVALVTPFDKNGNFDKEALGRVIEHVISGGVNYLVSLGTTGESVTLSDEERQLILEFTISKAAGRVPVIAGFGGSDTADLIRSIGNFNFEGISAILSVSPYYNKPTQEGIYRHYMAIDEASPVPIILYNVPARTSSNISAKTTLRLANDASKIMAIKEASGNLSQCMHIINSRPDGFYVLSGDDLLALPLIASGADGVISVTANALPSEFSKMVRNAITGDFVGARKLHYELLPFFDLFFREGNPGGVKCAMAHMDLLEENLRLPNFQVSDKLRMKILSSIGSLV